MLAAARLHLAAALALFAAVSGTRAEMIDDVLGSLSRGASFLERQHEHINLDGVVGFLVLQGKGINNCKTRGHSCMKQLESICSLWEWDAVGKCIHLRVMMPFL